MTLSPDNTVTVYSKHTEMGQGIYTGLATIVAEELDASWEQIRVTGSGADPALYANLDYGTQLTGGSTSIHNSWQQLRQTGAAVRQMLVWAAAERWGASESDVSVANGVLHHVPSGRTATFGELAELAARQPVPSSVALKPRKNYTLIGSELPRTDLPAKTRGETTYTQDLRLPNMLTAVVARPPRFDSTVGSFDDDAAMRSPGVRKVVQIPTGVAVIAKDFWSALQARDKLDITWVESDAFTMSSDSMMAKLRESTNSDGVVALEIGTAQQSLNGADSPIHLEYEFPYLAHAAMEPMNCVVQITDGGCEIWHGAQWQSRDQQDAADILGIPADRVSVHMLEAGSAFGRRATIDYTREAVEVARAAGTGQPVKLMWTREDDMRAGMYRPMFHHSITASVDGSGNLAAWHQKIAGQSIAEGVAPQWLDKGLDNMSVHGAADMPYAIPHVLIASYNAAYPIPVLWYRGTGRSHTVFAVETFLDVLAKSAGKDAVEFRLSLLRQHPRLSDVLKAVAQSADWGVALPKGKARGVALYSSGGTSIAQVAEITAGIGAEFSLDRVFTAVDVGLVINPDIVRAQVEGGTGFGLSSVLTDQITLNNGRVEQTNFDRYPVLRMDGLPPIETDIVETSYAPSGIGDFTPLVIGPALANAVFAATGTPVTKLPIRPPG